MGRVAAIGDFGTIESGLDFIESFQVYFQKKVISKYSYFKRMSLIFAEAGLLVRNGNEVIDDIYAYIDKQEENFLSDTAKDLIEKLERILSQYLPVVEGLKNDLSAPWFHINKHKKLITRYELVIEDLRDIIAVREAIAEGDNDYISWDTAKAELGL